MDSPHLDQFEDRELLGSGPSGTIFRARRPGGEAVAVKLLEGMAINRVLLEKACERLESGGWPKGVLPVIEADFRSRPAVRVTPCLADPAADGGWRPRSLQHRLAEFPGEDSWRVVLGIAEALAALHDRRVAHGNLKPGNVFFDDIGGVVLVDWVLGQMPGIGNLEYTDASLYQPPEQLRDAEGYLEEKGYRWDVYAFGALAYRLLTGRFPRCDATFQQVAPLAGETTREGIAADLLRIAKSVESETEVPWPAEPSNELERRFREVIDECLLLDPQARPANGLEVWRRLCDAEAAVKEEEMRDAVLDQRRRSQRAAWRASLAAGALGAAVVALSLLWQLTRSQLSTAIQDREEKVAALDGRLATAEGERDRATQSEAAAVQAMNSEHELWLARVEESREIGDRLFAWAMEKGHRNLPPLDGRELRLERLEEYFIRFIGRTAEVAALREERARARLQLAEISLAKGDPHEASKRLEEAIAGVGVLDEGPELELRLATDRLMLGLLLQDRNDPGTDEAFLEARNALEEVPQADVDADRVSQLLSILDIHESRQLAAAGDEAKALELLLRATENLNRLADNRPGATVLRSELVSCYLSSATILDGMGELGDARTVRTLAADKLLELIKERPKDLSLRLELAGCYGEIAESAVIAGDVANAEAMSNAAVKLLLDILPQRPDSAETRSRLAAQRALMAGILRDRGEAEKAMALYNEGLHLLEGIAIGEKADPMAKYRFALLTWEKGRMLGFAGDRDEEILHEQQAVAILEGLSESSYGVSHSEQMQRSLGYVLGDLGHAAQLGGQDELSAESFSKAAKIWESLNRDRPGNEEYEEALAWTRQRLDELH